MNTKDGVSRLLRELVTMLETGRPLYSSLTELASKEEDARLRTAVEEVAESIRKGGTLASAMAEHATVFDSGYVGLIRIFEDQMTALGGPRRNAPPA